MITTYINRIILVQQELIKMNGIKSYWKVVRDLVVILEKDIECL